MLLKSELVLSYITTNCGMEIVLNAKHFVNENPKEGWQKGKGLLKGRTEKRMMKKENSSTQYKPL